MLLAAAALALAAAAPGALGAELGRLFFTPQQRQELDRRRAANIQETVVTSESFITVNGHVSRSSGKSTTWINGVPEDDKYRGRDPGRVAVSPAEGEAAVPLNVGETWDRTRGSVNNRLGGGEVRIHRRPGRR